MVGVGFRKERLEKETKKRIQLIRKVVLLPDKKVSMFPQFRKTTAVSMSFRWEYPPTLHHHDLLFSL